MPTITQKPPSFILSANPAWFVVQASAADKRITASISHGATLIGQEHAFATTEGKASFELSEYFDTDLSPDISSVTESGSLVTLLETGDNRFSKQYTIKFEEAEGGNISTSHWAIKGRIDDHIRKLSFYGLLYLTFIDYINATLSFLSFRPKTTIVRYADQPERLYFFIYKPELMSPITVAGWRMHADGTTSTWNAGSIASPSSGGVYEIKTSYTALFSGISIDPKNPIVSYSVQLKIGSTAVSKEMIYLVDFSQPKSLTTFMFLNPAGGFDTFCASGRSETEYDSDKQISPLAASLSDQNVYRIGDVTTSTEEVFNTGFVSTETLNWLMQMISSKLAYVLIPSLANPSVKVLVPVTFIRNSFKSRMHTNDVHSARFRYQYNYPLKVEKDS